MIPNASPAASFTDICLKGPVRPARNNCSRLVWAFIVGGWLLWLVLATPAAGAGWTWTDGANPAGPGKAATALLDGKPVARLVYGEGQMKPYLHVFGEAGELLTNGGLDAAGKTTGQFPHHRGIFIGWKVTSELGTDDLWHMTRNCRMELVKFERLDATTDAATLVARIDWRSARKDADGSDLLLSERRTLVVSRPGGRRTQVDARFALQAARALSFGGDLQHSGVHFRAANEVAARAKQTSYLFEPDKVVKGNHLQWCRLLFPIGEQWYTSLEMNAPGNPVEELSMRDYGRFGYFFRKPFEKGEVLDLNYRFLIERADAPAEPPKPSAAQIAQAREACAAHYRAFVQALRP